MTSIGFLFQKGSQQVHDGKDIKVGRVLIWYDKKRLHQWLSDWVTDCGTKKS